MKDTLITLLPLVIFILVVYFITFKYQSPLAKLQGQYRERHIQHMERLEELLERITVALEKTTKQ